jgi:hypothetical protein
LNLIWLVAGMNRSCKTCGFFVSSANSSGKDTGYCLYFDLKDIEKKGIPKKTKNNFQ